MHTPFDNPAPTTYRERIEHYARDLAWGVEQELWTFTLDVIEIAAHDAIYPSSTFNIHPNSDKYLRKFRRKWFDDELHPTISDLRFWGFTVDKETGFELTQNAFDLLRQPFRSPRVFISYSHKNSSALALAIEARLKYLGNHDVFVDKSIPGGRKWEEVIEKNVLACDYFVLLVHENVFDSEFIKQEFDLALAENKTIYPVCHHGVNPNSFPEFSEIQSIRCEGLPSAKTFESAINDLLFWMGYPTY